VRGFGGGGFVVWRGSDGVGLFDAIEEEWITWYSDEGSLIYISKTMGNNRLID
jgi:hypothetical protein